MSACQKGTGVAWGLPVRLRAVDQGHGGMGNLEKHVSVLLGSYISIDTEANQPREVSTQIALQVLKDF